MDASKYWPRLQPKLASAADHIIPLSPRSAPPALSSTPAMLLGVALEGAADNARQAIDATSHIDRFSSDEDPTIGETQHRAARRMIGRLSSSAARGPWMLTP
jgi:hypothetical protein